MVKFIIGKANFDISARVRGELISVLENSSEKQKIIYIVPDQFEYETEKAVYKILEEKNRLDRTYEIKITTFSKLSSEILRESGELRPPADDIIKNIVMHKAVNDNKTALTSLSGISSKSGFCEKMVQTVSMFKTSGLSPRDLESSLEKIGSDNEKLNENSPVVKKLRDVSMLYENYELLLSDYIDSLDVTGMAADIIEKPSCTAFDGANVFVDCFNDFTNFQLRFLCKIIGKADGVSFGFAAEIDGESDVFGTARSHISRLKEQAEENGCEVKFITEGIPDRMEKNSPLKELSQKIFGNVKSELSLGESCELVSASSVYEEADYVCAKIKQLITEKGIRYRDIAVLCTDAGAYGRHIQSAFKKYDIPIFTDIPEPILYQPLINAVISVLNALRTFSVDTVLSCLKTGFFSKPDKESGERVGLSDKDIDVFESYIYEWSLETNHLKKPFTFKNSRVETDYNMQQAEEIRAAVAQPLLELRRKLPKYPEKMDGAELTELLYKFLTDDMGMQRALFARCEKEDKSGLDSEKVALYQRLWNSLMGIFDSLHAELDGTGISVEDYYRLFRDICSATTLATPPQHIDCVLVGDIDRTRADNIKAAFIVGASYEAFPTPASKTGIFSQYETELIRENITHIGENNRREYCLKSIREQYCLSLYRAYRAVSLPTEYLCISCPEQNASGESVQRSEVINGILGLFPDAKIIKASAMGNKFYCRSKKAAKLRYAFGINAASRENAVLKKVLTQNGCEDFVKRLDEIKSRRKSTADSENFSGRHVISERTAKRLFPNYIGATSVEKLNLCKFSYFCRYGLGIDEKNQRNFNRSKRGDAIHFVLENVLRDYCGDIEKFFLLQRSEFFALSRKYLKKYCELETNNDFSDDKRTEFLFNNIANSATDVLITVQAEFYARNYRPKFFELNIIDKDNPKYIIENERKCGTELPEAELYSGEEISADSPRPASQGKDFIETRPLVIRLDNGIEAIIDGRIDRVDMFTVSGEEKDKLYVRVVDYKSSVKSFDLNNARNGINIQMLLYLFALCEANENNPKIKLCPGGVSYVPSNSSGAVDSAFSPYRLLAMNHHESGLFIGDPVTKNDLERYTKFVFDKISAEGDIDNDTLIKIKEAFTPNILNSVDAESFNKLRGDCISKIKENLEALLGGDVSAMPLSYHETYYNINGEKKSKNKNACDYCRFTDICGNAGKDFTEIRKAETKSTKDKPAWENPYLKKEDDDGK